MAIAPYLAMTGAEMMFFSPLPPKIAWMACHFSPYATGLSNLPCSLPPDSVLMVNDITPIHGHDPERICKQLTACVEKHKCSSILLDFQRSGSEETTVLAKHLVETLPCPVAVSECYAEGWDCPVFLSPVPCHVPLEEHLEPWKGRDVWLELALEGMVIRLTEEGSHFAPLSPSEIPKDGLKEENLHCRYRIETMEAESRFTLWRTKGDLQEMLEEAEAIGIQTAVGLWQELN